MGWRVIGPCLLRSEMGADRRAISPPPLAAGPHIRPDLNMETSLNADSTIVEAEIRVGTATIRYRRAGTGAPVLLLQQPGSGSGEWEDGTEVDVFVALSQRHRVFQPLTPIPRRRDHAENWLRGVVEGLGLVMPDVVADPGLAPTLARLVRQEGGIVGRVTFLAGTRSVAE